MLPASLATFARIGSSPSRQVFWPTASSSGSDTLDRRGIAGRHDVQLCRRGRGWPAEHRRRHIGDTSGRVARDEVLHQLDRDRGAHHVDEALRRAGERA